MRATFLLALLFTSQACHEVELTGVAEEHVQLDTESEASRAQYEADLAFARRYRARCPAPRRGVPRALVTGFGRFLSIQDNASGRIVSALVPSASYPETLHPEPGLADLPEPQLSVGSETHSFASIGDVDICVMILPVHWDLASVLVAREIEAFQPDVVIMNGVAASVQPLYLEMGARNRASPKIDGSGLLAPLPESGELTAKLVENASEEDESIPMLASWTPLARELGNEITRLTSRDVGAIHLRDTLSGASIAGFPRPTNTYLCNGLSYVTSYLMDHPGKEIDLMRASVRIAGRSNELKMTLRGRYDRVPRFFLHWPSSLDALQARAASSILARAIEVQLSHREGIDGPIRGDNALSDPGLRGGATY